MKMIKHHTIISITALFGISFGLLTSCSSSRISSGGEVTGIAAARWSDSAPYGMVLISPGSIMAGPQGDSTWSAVNDSRGISVDAFWMDETEVTNAKYRQFVHWVRDSIIRERLADPAYCGNEDFKITEDREGNPIKPRLNWNKAIPWRTADEDEQRVIDGMYRTNPITGIKELDPTQLNYRYEVYNNAEAVKRKNRRNPITNEYDYADAPLITKDTAYIDEEGHVIRKTLTRRLTSEYDFINTYIVNVYPDTTTWINDFENSMNEPYVRTYFSHGNYDNHPVVGVSWEQANAYCNWRTEFLKRSLDSNANHIEPFRLPTEAEWEYAARAGRNENIYPWNGDGTFAEDRGCFYANFKPNEGNYARDGFVITSQVGAYNANDFGLYDMAGNVSEWTSTAYAENISRMTSDLNPEYRYDASPDDPSIMKRKIVRGGSWKDVSHNIRSDIRMWEYQSGQRSYIGFRCVRTHIGFSNGKQK